MNKKGIFNKLVLLIVPFLLSNLINANISTPQVTVTPNQTKTYAEYTISSSTGKGNTNLRANIDSIIVVFNSSTNVPPNIDASLVTVNNTASNAVDVSDQRIAILTPVNVAKNGGLNFQQFHALR